MGKPASDPDPTVPVSLAEERSGSPWVTLPGKLLQEKLTPFSGLLWPFPTPHPFPARDIDVLPRGAASVLQL